MNACIAPHSSEHCPETRPKCGDSILIVTTLPGMASAFTPSPGAAIAWMTSTAESITVATRVVQVTEILQIPNNSPRDNTWEAGISADWMIQYHCSPITSKYPSPSVSCTNKTNWLIATTPEVGMTKAKNSSFREETDPEDLDPWRELFSVAPSSRQSTAVKAPVRSAHRTDETQNIDYLNYFKLNSLYL
jgi:hypothetical protein